MSPNMAKKTWQLIDYFLLCGTPTESIAMHITYHNVNETGTLQNIITIQNVRLLSYYSVILFVKSTLSTETTCFHKITFTNVLHFL